MSRELRMKRRLEAGGVASVAWGLRYLVLGGLGFLAACDINSPTGSLSGSIIDAAPIRLFVAPGVPLSGRSYAMTYRSRDRAGRWVPVTATVTTPLFEWRGPGQRPIVAYAMGTHGVGENCAPSRMMAVGSDYEAAFVELLLLQGYGVVVTDYLGFGTGEPATYINRLDQGHAVLDALRAAQTLPEAGLPDDGPVATFGYSQGGLGSAAALELQPSYAPELRLIGGYAGAIPSDLIGALDTVDGTVYAGLMGNAILGMNAAYPANRLLEVFNDAGRSFIARTREECVPLVVVPHVFTRSTTLTVDGRSLGDHFRDRIWQKPFARLEIGKVRPSAPALVIQSVADDVVPFNSSRDAAAGWCELGATVDFRVAPVPTHIGALPVAAVEAIAWLAGRIAGEPAQRNCGVF